MFTIADILKIGSWKKSTYVIHSSFLPQQKLSAFLEKGDDDFDPSYSLVSHKHCYCWWSTWSKKGWPRSDLIELHEESLYSPSLLAIVHFPEL